MGESELNSSEVSVLRELAASLGITLEEYRNTIGRLGKTAEEQLKLDRKLIKSHEDRINKSKKTFDQTIESITNLKTGFNAGAISTDQLSRNLEYLREEVRNTADATQRQHLLELKDGLERAHAADQASKIFNAAIGKTLVAGLGGAAKGVSAFATAALKNADAITMTGELMKSMWDAGNASMQSGSAAMREFGKVTMAAGGSVGKWGVGAELLGAGLSAASGLITDLAKAGIDFTMSKTKSFLSDFTTMSAAGAVYVDGLEGMIQTANSAGMTLSQFTKVVSANKEIFSKAGLGVAEGSKRMAKVMDVNSPEARKMREGMFALGMSAEDQADAVAKTMGMMAGSSGQLQSGDAAIREQTETYAKNLKLISDLTGQDAKARAEKVRQDNDTLAFNSYMNGLSEEQRIATKNAMDAMSETDARAFREKALYNNVISADLGIARATNSSLRKNQDEQWAAAQAGLLNAKLVAKGYEEHGKGILAANNELGTTIGRARSGAGVDASKALNESGQHAIKWANASKRMAEIEEAKRKGELGADPSAQLMAAEQKLATSMDELAEKQLKNFASAVDDTIKKMEWVVNAGASIATALGSWTSWIPVIGGAVLSIATSVASLLIMSKVGKGAGAVASAGAGLLERGAGGAVSAGASRVGGGISQGAGNMVGGLANGIAKFGDPKVMLGATTFVILGASLWVTSKALVGFQDLEWETIGKGLTAIAGLGAIGAIAGLAAPLIGMGALALGGMGLALLTFPTETLDSISNLIPVFSEGLVTLSTGADPVVLAGLAASFTALGVSFVPLAASSVLLSNSGFDSVVTGLNKFSQLDQAKLSAVANSVAKVTASLPGPIEMAKMAAIGLMNKVTDTDDATVTATNSSSTVDTSMLSELRRISTSITESIKTAALTLESQQKLVDLAGDQIRALEKLTRHVA